MIIKIYKRLFLMNDETKGLLKKWALWQVSFGKRHNSLNKVFFFDRTKVTVILFVIFSDLRSDNRTTYLEGIKSAFNFREEKKTSKQWRIATGYLQDFRSGRLRKVITFNFNFLHVINQLITCHDMWIKLFFFSYRTWKNEKRGKRWI